MTANQRRPGFRLPWSSEEDGSPTDGETAVTDAGQADATAAAPQTVDEAAAPPAAAEAPAEAVSTAPETSSAPVADAAATVASAAAAPEATNEFMRDLVAAMRGVAEEARDAGLAELRTSADEQVSKLEADAEKRREELRNRAETDVAGVGEWAKAEAERIKKEAEQKVVTRRAKLDEELGADASRTEAETKAVRDRVAEYEQELAAYHAQLSEINDPAAFAAAAKRLPKAPVLSGLGAAAPSTSSAPADARDSNGVATETSAAEEMLASRLAQLGATQPESPTGDEPTTEAKVEEAKAEEPPAEEAKAEVEPAEQAKAEEAPAEEAKAEEAKAEEAEPVVAEAPPATEAVPAEPAKVEAPAQPVAAAATAITEVVVKGLGSFGAITGFRQSLSGVEGIDSVALSLGQTGEFVFRASHAPGFDVRGAIVAIEGDGAKVEDRAEGGLRVTLERAR